MGERLPCKQGVESSNLSVSIARYYLTGRTLKTEYQTEQQPKPSIETSRRNAIKKRGSGSGTVKKTE